MNTSLSSQTQSPDGRGAVSSGTTVVTSSPSNSASQAGSGSLLTEAQKHQMLLHHHQQQIAAMGHLTVSAHNDVSKGIEYGVFLLDKIFSAAMRVDNLWTKDIVPSRKYINLLAVSIKKQ